VSLVKFIKAGKMNVEISEEAMDLDTDQMDMDANPVFMSAGSKQPDQCSSNLDGSHSDKIVQIDSTRCVACSSLEIEFTTSPCECCNYCKKCAMKIATGGKCKSCHSMFSTMKRR
jgi:hypothetical protein